MGALKMASQIKGIDMTKVVVDDDQAPPAIAAHSEEEGALLREMEGLLAPGSSAKAAGVELKLMCLRGRKYEPDRAAELLPTLLDLIDELDLKSLSERMLADLATGKFIMTGAKDSAGTVCSASSSS